MLSENRSHGMHWIGVAAVAAVLALGFSELHGQGLGAGAATAAEGRPAMAGAQGGLGAQPGLQQGGLGVRGLDGNAQVQIQLKRPSAQAEPPLRAASDVMGTPAGTAGKRDPMDVSPVPKKTDGLKPEGSATGKAARATKRSLERARHGVGGVDASGGVATKP